MTSFKCLSRIGSSDAVYSRYGLVLVLALAFFLRVWQINESLWLDELHTAWVVHGPFSEITQRARIGNQSPLYFMLVWMATAILGNNELGLRFLSLASGVALVGATFWLIRKWTGNPLVACCGATLVAWDRNFIFYSQEARPYALMQLVAVGQVVSLWCLQQSNRHWLRATYVLGTVLLIYLHITAALLLVAECIWLLPALALRRRGAVYEIRHFAVDMICVAAAVVPLIPQLLSIASRRASWALFAGNHSWSEMAGWFSLEEYVVLPLFGLVIASLLERSGNDRPAAPKSDLLAIYLVTCWFVVPVVVAWLATITETARLFFPRYLLASALAPIIFAGLCLSAVRQVRIQNTLLTIVLGVSVYQGGTVQRFLADGRFLHDRNQDWPGAAQLINSTDGPFDRPVLVRSGFLEADRLLSNSSDLLRRYCLATVTSLYQIDAGHQFIPLPTTNSGHLDDVALSAIRQRGGAWFVVNGSARTHAKFERDLAATLQQHGLNAGHYVTTTFGEVLVIELRLSGYN